MPWSFYPVWGWGYDEMDARARRLEADRQKVKKREDEERADRRRREEKASAVKKKHQQEVAYKAKQQQLQAQYQQNLNQYGSQSGGTGAAGGSQGGGQAGGGQSAPANTGIMTTPNSQLNRGGFFDGSLAVQNRGSNSTTFTQARPALGMRKSCLNRGGFFDGGGVGSGGSAPAAAGDDRPGFFDNGSNLVRAGFDGGNTRGASGSKQAPKPVQLPKPQTAITEVDSNDPNDLAAAAVRGVSPTVPVVKEYVEPGSVSLEGTSQVGKFVKW